MLGAMTACFMGEVAYVNDFSRFCQAYVAYLEQSAHPVPAHVAVPAPAHMRLRGEEGLRGTHLKGPDTRRGRRRW